MEPISSDSSRKSSKSAEPSGSTSASRTSSLIWGLLKKFSCSVTVALAFENSRSVGPPSRRSASSARIVADTSPTRSGAADTETDVSTTGVGPGPIVTPATGEYESPSSSRTTSVRRLVTTSWARRATRSSRRATSAVALNTNETLAVSPSPARASTTTVPSGGGGSVNPGSSSRDVAGNVAR